MKKTEYPRFITNKPHGNDFYEGKSSFKIALDIKNHIETVNKTNEEISDVDLKLPQIIGLEGARGSGKSNAIKRLKKEFKNDFYVFEYDAWIHQEDLQRRSFLERLTEELIDQNILFGETKIKAKGGGFVKGDWTDKLKYVLSIKRETVSEKYPIINEGFITLSVTTILIPIFIWIAKITNPSINSISSIILSSFIVLIPILMAFALMLRACRKNPKLKKLDYFFAIYQNKIESYSNYETINEEQPSVKEFKDWMNDISNFITENNKGKLIIVFDNMDRLSSEKVKQLWSIIYTFFTEDGYKNIWAIVPYDKDHLAYIYIDLEINDKKLEHIDKTKQFISKTFPIVYRVNPPIITDRSKLFFDYFNEAFEDTEDNNKALIQKMFEIKFPEINPRIVINFINEVVRIRRTEGAEISIISIIVYVLQKDDFEKNPAIYILNKGYHKIFNRLIEDSVELQTEIAALFYGVSKEMAKQLPLINIIDGALIKGEKITEYYSQKHFDEIFSKQINDLNIAHIDNAVNCLKELSNTNVSIKKHWNHLAQIFISEFNISKLRFEEYQKTLFFNVDTGLKKKIISRLVELYQNIDINNSDAVNYYIVMNEIDETIISNKIEIDINELIGIKVIDPEPFIDYVNIAKEKYSKFKLSCDKSILNHYLINKMEVLNSYKLDFVKIIKESEPDYFEKLKTTIESFIENIEDWDASPIIEVYKLISNEKPLKKQLSFKQLTKSINKTEQYSTDKTKFDFMAMNLILNTDNFEKSSSPPNEDSFNYIVDEISKQIEYYKDFGSLIELSLNTNSKTLKAAVVYLTLHPVGSSKINLKVLLPRYKEISNYLDIPEDDLLKRFASCEYNSEDLKDQTIIELLGKDNISVFKEMEQIN